MTDRPECERFRLLLDERWDGPIDAGREADLGTHLKTCAACRDYEEGQRLVRRALRELPVVPLPDVDLRAVWSRTIESAPHRPGWRSLDWRALAAAAAIAGITLLSLEFGRPKERVPSEAEVARATEEARLVFSLTAQAMKRSEQAAVGTVLQGEVSPAVRRIPLRWPERGGVESRRSG